MNSRQNTEAILLPFQQRWVKDRSPVKVAEKSRQIGFSWTEAADSSLTAAGKDGMDVWYIGYNKDMAQEFIDDCAFWVRKYNLAASHVEEVVVEDENRDIQSFRIRFASGHKITALSSRPANLRGKRGKVIIDEAAFHDDLAGLIKAALALIMWGGRVSIMSTHNGEDNYFNELIQDIRAGKKNYSLHRCTLDDALKQGLYKRICLRLGHEWSREAEREWRQALINRYGEDAGEELFCMPSRGSGVYLPRALVETCMDPEIPVLRWRCKPSFAELPEHIRNAEARDWCEENLDPLLRSLNPNLAHYFGEDFGRSGDLTVIFPLTELQGLSYRAPFVVELRNVPFKQQEQILFYIVDRLPRFMGGALDARGNGQYLAEVAMQRYGSYRIQQVMLSTEWYRENMPRYKAAFEDRTISIPRDSDILMDHRQVKMEKGVARVPDDSKTKGTDGGQRHGDSAIAGALALFAATCSPKGDIEFQTTGIKRAYTGLGRYLM